jgi:hypothetical protein
MNGQPDSALRQCERQVEARSAGRGRFEAAVGQAYIAWSLVDGCIRSGGPAEAGPAIAEAEDDQVATLG